MKKKFAGLILTIAIALSLSAAVYADITYELCDDVPSVTIIPLGGDGNVPEL